MAMAPERTGIGIHRVFTTEGVHPYDEVTWERRDARITNYKDGTVAFEQLGVEVPASWSLNATNILAQKYFRGTLGTPERESSLRQVADRVVDTITAWGVKDGYFVDEAEAAAFNGELKHLIVTQKAAFNSPVWFNIGVKGVPQQASACQPWHALVHTTEGLVPIGELVERNAVGTKVLDARGVTKIIAVKHNGSKRVLRITTKSGHRLDVTPDHLVWRASGDGTGSFVEAGSLSADDQIVWVRAESEGHGEITNAETAEAALAGWLQSDGFVGQYLSGTNRSLTIEAMTVSDAEHAWVEAALDVVLPGAHRKERTVDTISEEIDCRRTRLYGEVLRPFVERWGLLTRDRDMTVPRQLFTAPLPVVRAYLRSIFQAEGYVSLREHAALVGCDMVCEQLVRGVQQLLGRFGIFSRVRFKADRRGDRQGCWSLAIRSLPERRRFADEIGFVDPVKASKLAASLELDGIRSNDTKRLEIATIDDLGEMDVYDIQTESGEYLSGNLRVHNCFILHVDDTMDSILNWYVEEGTIFKGGSGAGINLSRIRSSKEIVKGGGTASGPVSFMRGADASAGTIKCLRDDTPITTDHGVVPIRDVQPGARVLTRFGFKRVEAVHDNGVRSLVRVRTALGDDVVCTPEHRFRVRSADGETWRRAGDLRADDYITLDLDATTHGQLQALTTVAPGHHNEIMHALPELLDEPFAMWLGWVVGDGSITSRPSAKFVAVQIGDADPELVGRYEAITRSVFGPEIHCYVDRHADKKDASASVRFASSRVVRFLEANGLRKAIAAEACVPDAVKASPAPVRAAFLSGLFEADGHVGNGHPWLSTVSPTLATDVHRLLLSLGIPSILGRITDRRTAFGKRPVHTVRVVGCEGVRRFAKLVGFVSERKHAALEAAVTRKDVSPFESQWFLPHVDAELNRVWQGSENAQLRRALAPYCRSARPRRMSLLRARVLLERYPDELGATPLVAFASGASYYAPVTVEAVPEGPTFDLTVEDVHEYLVNSVVTHNSGGKTRRAAKMVILNADHPDIEDFIWCKAIEERKARVLRDAGFDMDLDGRDSHSTQYQNANNSVRVTDEFMQAVIDDADWHLHAVTTGEVVETVKARDIFHQIAQATWECADPGMQFDTTINRWHTAANTGRINGSNPCCFVGETLVVTVDGLTRIDALERASTIGQPLPHVVAYDISADVAVDREVIKAWVAGDTSSLVEITTASGSHLRCTPEHRFLLADGRFVEAQDLLPGTKLRGATVGDSVERVERIMLDVPVPVYDLEVEGVHNFAVSGDGDGAAIVVHNSEYMHLDNSACNLASLNLLKFSDDEADRFDVEGFKAAVEVIFTAQEILVGNADYPTEAIGETSRRFRQLGIGYANLGALLMAMGLPYDSDAGRAWAGALTALMTGHAYATSAKTAARMGPFAGYTENAEHMKRVLNQHRAAAAHIDEELVPPDLLSAAQESWDHAVDWAELYGVRNSQASVLAPTGCLVGGTLVPTDRGLVRLRSLGDVDGEQWQDLEADVMTDDGIRAATKFYVNGLEQVVDVVTERGHRIQGTTKHRIKVVDRESGEWAWRRFSDLRPGDMVPLALDQLVGDPQRVALPPLGEGYRWSAEHDVRAPREMTAELAELVGYFMGDGSLHARGLRFCVDAKDIDVIEHLERLGKSLFGIGAHSAASGGDVDVCFNSVQLVDWWEACGFAKRLPREGHRGKGWTPFIPDAVLYTNDREIYRAFLRGLFEADGTVTAGYPSWTTSNMDFSHEVQSLLLALGYPTTRKFDTSGRGSRLAVLRLLNQSMNERWLAEIDFIGGRKHAAVHTSDVRQTARYDHIPASRTLIDRVVPDNGRDRRVALMELRRAGSITRRLATELYERTGDAELGHLLSFFYDRVAVAELGDEELTYDISVPENVTYVANGFVSHNTIGLLMDCDTTGVEPDLGLVKFKKLVGGGTMQFVNQTIPRALVRLGYSLDQISSIVAHIDQHKTILGAPGLRPEHVAVFACSMGDNPIHYLGHVKMMGAVQPFISGAISKCVAGGTLLTTSDGLVRIGSLHDGEAPDTFRHEVLEVASLAGNQKTDAFYYGGVRAVREVVLRSGHRVVGTGNHRLLVGGSSGLEWKELGEIEPGDMVAARYAAELWSSIPASLLGFSGSPRYGCQTDVRVPAEMSEELAFLLGAYASEGHTTRSNWTLTITNSVESVRARVVAAWREIFGIEAKVVRSADRCPQVVVASKTIVELFSWLGCGDRAATKRIPDAVLRSPRTMMLAFLQGLALDAYTTVGSGSKWAICLDAPGMLDDLQAVLTNLGIVHSRIEKWNPLYEKSYGEVYATGSHAKRLVDQVPFLEPDKATAAAKLLSAAIDGNRNTADTVPGISPSELYSYLPKGQPGRNGKGTGTSKEFAFLCDPRTKVVTRASVARVAAVPGVELPMWLRQVLDDGLHFSPVVSVADAGKHEVFDISVPMTHAFVGNGIVNHNTVNMPEEVTVEDVEQLHVDAWRLGVKAVAIYRDNCKVAQPLAVTKKDADAVDVPATTVVAAPQVQVVEKIVERVVEKVVTRAQRERMPRRRRSNTFKFRVADCEGFVHVGEFDDGRPGELFIKVAKQGSTLAGIMDAFGISISVALQHGVPLSMFVKQYTNMRFEPAGMTDDPDIRFASSLLDYIFRRLAIDYLPFDQRMELGILAVSERLEPTLPGIEEAVTPTISGIDTEPSIPVMTESLDLMPRAMPFDAPPVTERLERAFAPSTTRPANADAPYCMTCGVQMIRAGSCHACPSCGSTSGCS